MATDAGAVRELTVGGQDGKSKPSTFKLTEDSLYVKRPSDPKWPDVHAPLRHVVWAEVTDGKLEVSVLARKGKKGSLALVHLTGSIPEAERADAAAFTEAVMDAAYKGVKRQRSVLVLVNPISGPGKSRIHLAKKILPVLKAAHCTSEVILTTHYKHAWEIARDLPLGKYDAIAAVSGDGIIHEILNGFAEHKDPLRALSTPVAPIPAGSANALSLNILGLEEGFDISAATLNVVKGRPMKVDVCSVTQKEKRVLSFMSQAIGLMAELDLGTEHLRFMGDARFVYGFLRGLVRLKPCPAKISIKVAETDKTKMLEDLRKGEAAAAQRVRDGHASTPEDVSEPAPESASEPSGERLSALPQLVHTVSDDKEGWVEFDKPNIYLMAGKGPLVARDLMQFPMSLPDDGVVDVVIQERSNRKEMIKAMDGAELGRTYWMDTQRYYKALAFRVEPTADTSFLSVDGEAYPFEPFAVEVHKGLATFLSPYGVYNVKFNEPDTRKKA